jgi:acyl-CoA synthetase (AMP-forming)/AMP-acid ligase II
VGDVAFATLGDVVARWRSASPSDPAIITGDGVVTIEVFAALVDDLVGALDRLAPPGGRVGLLAPNGVTTAALLYAVPASGRTLVPLNGRLLPAEQRALLERSSADVLLGEPVAGFDGTTVALDELVAIGRSSTRPDPPLRPEADDVAWVIFTSGTTGRPKGVLVTHASLAAAVRTTAAGRPLADDDVYLYPFPLFHVSAYNVLHAHARRRPVVLPTRFDASEVLEMSEKHAVTAMSLAPTMLRMLLDELTASGRRPPSHLRTIAYGAAPMAEALLREASDVLGCGFAQGYGMTELSGNAVFLSPADHRRGLDGEARFLRAAGYPGPGVHLRLVDEAGAEVANGASGEITVAAEQVCAGYLDDPASSGAAIVDGWLHTGDVGVVDPDGLLHVVDRAKDLVVTGGENVSSREVEEALLTHPLVAQAAVIGLPDERWGEAVTACIVVRVSGEAPVDSPIVDEAALTEALRAHVGTQLAGYKKPRRVIVLDALPVNAGGKVDKPLLRTRYR